MRRQVLDVIREEIQRIFQTHAVPLIAVDGRCASGKTTLAAQMQQEWDRNVIHMDDFFLRPEQRTEERLRQPGGNVDWERFRKEVLTPFRQGVPFSYRPYDCHIRDFQEPVRIIPDRLTVVEGSYSCHPKLWSDYDLHIFLSFSSDEQLRRIQARNGSDNVRDFQRRWIPLEERYFQAFQIAKICKVEDYSFVDLEAAYCFTGKTDEEKSLVCTTDSVPPNAIARDDGWKALRIQGLLDFGLIGILSRISTLLADSGIPIFAISTYNTDYVFVKSENYQKAMKVLEHSGYMIEN